MIVYGIWLHVRLQNDAMIVRLFIDRHVRRKLLPVWNRMFCSSCSRRSEGDAFRIKVEKNINDGGRFRMAR